MKKILIYLVALMISTITLFVGTGCSSSEADEIDKVIEQVNRIEEWDVESSDKDENLRLLRRTITNMKAINTSHCPQDFRISYEHFIQTLENLYVLALDAPESIFGGMVSIFTGWAGKAEKALKECENAHSDVNLIAAKHGAKKRLKSLE